MAHDTCRAKHAANRICVSVCARVSDRERHEVVPDDIRERSIPFVYDCLCVVTVLRSEFKQIARDLRAHASENT